MKIIEPKITIQKLVKKLDKNDILIIVATFLFGIINNFYFLIGDGVAPDALEVSPSFFYFTGNWEIQLGRFFIKYINLIRFGLTNKLIIVLISLSCIAISILLLRRVFNINNSLVLFLLSSIISIAPQFTETYMFIYCADAYLFAFLLCSLAIYLLNNKKKYILSIICISIMCAIYQAYLGVALALIVLLLVDKLLTNKLDIKQFIKVSLTNGAMVLIGVLVYYIILSIVLNNTGLQLASYKGANSLGLETIKLLPKTIANCYKDYYNFFFDNSIIKNSWYHRKHINLLLALFTFLGLADTVIRNKNKRFIRIILIIVLLAVFPICANVMNLISDGVRINLVTAPGILISALLPMIILEKTKNNNFANTSKWFIIVGCILLSWTFIVENTYTYVAREETYNNYKFITADIYNKVTSLKGYTKETKWMFSDVIRYQPKDLDKTNGFISKDNVTWNNYDGLLLNRKFFAKHYGIYINMVDKLEYDKIKNTKEFKEMSVYPEPNSIKIIQGVVVIKVSDNTY